ncbi:MAG: hypothetical protein EOP45_09175 [Sphingobacteriaceae bacterium]|nr:MAG: hypothetical protein EOP45_09175 [Sphingobacteriaceae bacterium]
MAKQLFIIPIIPLIPPAIKRTFATAACKVFNRVQKWIWHLGDLSQVRCMMPFQQIVASLLG